MFVKRAVVEELGGFDEDFFMQMEEIDLSWRMKLAGYHVRSVPSAVILHEGGASLQGGYGGKNLFQSPQQYYHAVEEQEYGRVVLAGSSSVMLDVVTSIYYLTQLSGGVKKSGAVWRAIASNIRQDSGNAQKKAGNSVCEGH
jgi:GT2 family glycosyltransferase